MTHGPARPCACCGRTRKVTARGMCNRCYDFLLVRGEHVDFPRRTRRAEDVAQDLREMQAQGCTRDEIAARIGLKWDSIMRAVNRLERRRAAA